MVVQYYSSGGIEPSTLCGTAAAGAAPKIKILKWEGRLNKFTDFSINLP